MAAHIRVLLVEDSEDDAELIRLELEKAGFELEWRRVETEAAFMDALGQPWDLIISDFRMPGFDGLRAFTLYKQRRIDTPFIFVSGALGEDRAVQAMRAGARDYLLKENLARLNVAVKRELAEAESRARRRHAEEATRREQRRLAIAVEASGAGVFEHRVPLGPDTYLSDRWAGILGCAPGDLPRYDGLVDWLLGRVHADDLPLLRRAYDEIVLGPRDDHAVELRLRHAGGHWVDVAVFAKVVGRDNDERGCHIVGVMLDLTERRRLENQLRQAQKMEAVGRLAGGVAHDFNNLLTAIFSFGSFVLDALPPDAPAHEDMHEVLKAAKKAETLTAQLLAFSRRKTISPRNVDINALVADMDRMLRRVVGEDISVSTTLADDLWTVRLDPGSLEQVIVNMAVNARDAMPLGGNLTIETANVELDEAYGRERGVAVPPGAYVRLAISDNGTGMDEDTQRKIFEPFYTTKDSKGTGLGLSTCYGIVHQANGYIWVYSEPDKGTTFKLYLPRIPERAEPIAARPAPTTLRGSETVLVAEDDPQVRRLAVRALSQLGYRVIDAENGREALRAFEHASGAIDLLITDVVMPEMSGRQLVQRLLDQGATMEVLYMSGYTANAIVHRGVLEPGTNMLEKPFTPDSLARKVREVLDDGR